MYNKRGQVTLFIILAIILVGIVALFYFMFPRIKTTFETQIQNPETLLQNCLKDKIEDTVNTISLQGGSINPELFYLYQGNKVRYLCYTEEYYAPCVMQQVFLEEQIETEIKNEIQAEANSCFDRLEESFKSSGYDVELTRGELKVDLLPKIVLVTFNNKLVLSRGGSSQVKEKFDIILDNNLYELAGISGSILEWETQYGDTETTLYMTYYRDLRVEKKKQDDGTTVYILTNKKNQNKFQFASRSVPWPPGYA